MKVERNQIMRYTQFVDECAEEKLVENCKKAFYIYYEGGDSRNYYVIDIQGYFCIAKATALTKTIATIQDDVQPFDENKVYPRQKIKQIICFTY